MPQSQQLFQTVKIRCPHCHQEGTMQVLPALNTAQAPELKEKVISKEVFEYTCPGCLQKNHLNYTFLYHEPEKQLMIQFIAGDHKAWINAVNEFRKLPASISAPLRSQKYRVRAVRSQNALVEKIQIYNCDLDDRVIELLKLLLAADFVKNKSGRKPDNAYFYAAPDGTRSILFFSGDENIGAASVPEDLYLQVAEKYGAVLKDNHYGELILVDSYWAKEAMKENKKLSEG